ncbi:MAG: hypothetical protein ABH883_01480 [Candidatus Omnitrophota bacterium]
MQKKSRPYILIFMKQLKRIISAALIIAAALFLYRGASIYFQENAVLKQVISRLRAESRIAEILVTGVIFDENTKKRKTTIKFLEYDVSGKPIAPRYFTFTGNIIQFQSLVIRFDDRYVQRGDRLKGKSVYLFWKVFALNGKETEEYEISRAYEIPDGYMVEGTGGAFQKRLWENFWKYALDERKAKEIGIKNAQIEAPGTMFIPGRLYTVRIEHDGGMRIDSSPLSKILEGEKIPPEKETTPGKK